MNTLSSLILFTHDGDWGHSWWPLWLLFWAALIGLGVWFVIRRRGHRHDPLDRAREVLAERFASGELTGEEYRQRLDELQRLSEGAASNA
jgi:putative membrane protein